MAKIPSLTAVAQKELLAPKSLGGILLVFLAYFFFTVFVSNTSFFLETLFGTYPLLYKLHVLFLLLLGIFTAFSPLDIAITIMSAILVGVNIVLLIKTILYLEHQGKVSLSVGGATIIGLVSTGCASCGLSVLSLLGLSASLSFLPFHGLEVHVLSVILLAISSWYMVKKLRDGLYCSTKR